MSFFLGIDAGGTKTECVLADAVGVSLARGVGGPANLRRTALSTLRESVHTAIASTLRNAGLRTLELEAVCAGFAGAGQAQLRETARRVLFEVLSTRHLFIVGDMEVALEAAVGLGRGVVLIAGTGSIAYGRNDMGRQARAGGRGPLVSDEGSAWDIGRRALEAVLRAKDGHGSETALEAVVQEHFKLADRLALTQLLTNPEASAQLAALLPAVVDVAQRRDRVARVILLDAGSALARLASTVLRALQLEATPTCVAISGGVFSTSLEVGEEVRRCLQNWAPHARVEQLTTAPAEGAVRLAQRLWLQKTTGLPVVS